MPIFNMDEDILRIGGVSHGSENISIEMITSKQNLEAKFKLFAGIKLGNLDILHHRIMKKLAHGTAAHLEGSLLKLTTQG